MKRVILILGITLLTFSTAEAQKEVPHRVQTCQKRSAERTEIILPQVNGYNIYKGDFHTHTMYSDGRVSPKGRVMKQIF